MAKEVDVEQSSWGKRYVRLSEPFLVFFPIWFTLVFFTGLSIWVRVEAMTATPLNL